MASGIRLKPTGAAGELFHVTAHGIGDLNIFGTDRDKLELIDRIQNHMSPFPEKDSRYRRYVKLHNEVAILGFAIMRNHLHLVLQQFTDDGMRRLMQRVLGSYGRYYNDGRGRRGAVFDGRYAAQHVSGPDHLRQAIAYVHLNHVVEQLDYRFTSHDYFVSQRTADWLDVPRALRPFGGVPGYINYLNLNGPAIIAKKLTAQNIDPTTIPYRPVSPKR